MKKLINLIAVILSIFLINSCSSGPENSSKTEGNEKSKNNEEAINPIMENKGIGPINEVKLGAVNSEMAKKGESLFLVKCSSCHAIDKKIVGPSLAEITNRRSPEWIMNMILNPEVMVAQDPIAKELFTEYSSNMTNMNLTKQEARDILEYFRDIDK